MASLSSIGSKRTFLAVGIERSVQDLPQKYQEPFCPKTLRRVSYQWNNISLITYVLEQLRSRTRGEANGCGYPLLILLRHFSWVKLCCRLDCPPMLSWRKGSTVSPGGWVSGEAGTSSNASRRGTLLIVCANHCIALLVLWQFA